MTPDLCEGAWSWERALATVRGWQHTTPDPEDCQVTARMVERTAVLLRAVHAAGVPCPQVWRGPSSVMLDWRFRWPRRLPSGEKFRRACIDVEDDTDDEGSIGCVCLYIYRDSTQDNLFVGWQEATIAHLTAAVADFLAGGSMATAAERVAGGCGSATRPGDCVEYSSGPYTCQPSRSRPAPLVGGVCRGLTRPD